MKKTAPPPESPPTDAAGCDRFKAELVRLVAQFEKNFKLYQSPAYSEASVRQDFLDPLFRALGWDVGNRLGLIPQHREVEIESRTEISGRQKRADYLFRTDRVDRFVCEAKKPAETLHAGHAFQAKRYAWNKNLVLAVLSDFEEIKIYLVGARPHADDPDTGYFQTWHYLEYVRHAPEIWNLLSRDAVAAGSIEKLVAALPRQPAGKTRAKQMWLFKPDRARAIDADFLDFLDEARRGLASDLIRRNDRADLLEGARLDEAVQRILDRLLFLRICEDRDIDTGRPLANVLKSWRDRAENPPPRKLRAPALPLHEAAAEYAPAAKPAPPESLWREIVAHFRALDRRPASHVPYFNGNLFKEHFSESLAVGDDWLAGFLDEIGDDESPYLFNVIPVEILGTIYERFLGKTVRPHGRGVVIEEKPEVRKAGGVYYTPRYIVDYIVEQTLGKLIDGKAPLETLKLRVLDPACGSGSFLIRAFERLCEHWQSALTQNEKLRRKTDCWTDPATGDLHLTTDLKRRILTASIYGVDLDPGAVEVTQLSLYLKMLEGESRATLAQNRELFGPDVPLLPPLQDNVKCGNSLIASDFSLNPDDLVRVRAFDWDVQFKDIMKNGGFDAVVGNPPWGQKAVTWTTEEKQYLRNSFRVGHGILDLFKLFCERSILLAKTNGCWGMILPDIVLLKNYPETRRFILETASISEIAFAGMAFEGADIDTVCITARRANIPPDSSHQISIIRALEPPPASNLASGDPLPQSLFWKLQDYKFNIHLDPARLKLMEKLQGLPRLDSIFEAHEGIHSGNIRAKLFVDEQTNRFCKKMIFGRDEIGRYLLQWGGRWVNYHEGIINRSKNEYANLANPRYFESPKVFVRRTGDFVMAVPDFSGLYASNNLFVVLPKEGVPTLNIHALVGLLNSRFMTWFFRTIQPRVGKVFAELKINQLHQFPLPADEKHASTSKRLAPLVDKMLLLVPKLRAAKSETERATLQNAVAATDRAIDALVYELYGLTPEEIALVEGAS